MSLDLVWFKYCQWKFGRPMQFTDAFDEDEWQDFQDGWDALVAQDGCSDAFRAGREIRERDT